MDEFTTYRHLKIKRLRLRHISSKAWGTKRYMNMDILTGYFPGQEQIS